MTTLTNGLNLIGGGTARGYLDAVTTIGNRITGYPISHDEAIHRLLGHLNFSGTLDERLAAFEDRYGTPFHLADPDTVPDLILDFAARDRLDDIPGWSYSRTGPASYVDGSGRLVIDLERTNLHLNSGTLSSSNGWTVTKTALAANRHLAPDGLNTASEVGSDGTASAENETLTGPAIAGTDVQKEYTCSIFAKPVKGGQNWVRWGFHDVTTNANEVFAYFNVLTGATGTADDGGQGTIGATSIEAYPDGWYRISITGITTTSTSGQIAVRLYLADGNEDVERTGDTDKQIAIWGVQCEESSGSTDYISTTSTTVSITSSRLDHDPSTGEALGLLVEESRTNFLPESEDLNAASWLHVGTPVVTVNAASAPDGSSTADQVASDGSTVSSFYDDGTVSEAAAVACSIFVKPKDTSGTHIAKLFLRDVDAGNNLGGIQVTNTNGTLSFADFSGPDDWGYEAYPDGWYRVWLVETLGAGNTAARWNFWTDSGSSQVSTWYLWGAQLEEGAFPTSYIPTSGAAETRGADGVKITNLSDNAWWNESEGSALIRWSHKSNLANSYLLEAAVDISNRIGFVAETSNRGVLYLVSGGSVVASPFLDPGPLAVDTDHKFAGGWKANDSRIAIGGMHSALASTGNPPTGLTDLHVGDHVAGGNSVNGHIKSVAIWDNRRPDAELEALTE